MVGKVESKKNREGKTTVRARPPRTPSPSHKPNGKIKADQDIVAIKRRLEDIYSTDRKEILDEQTVKDAFEVADDGGDGYVSRSDFKKIVKKLKLPLRDSEVLTLMNAYSTGGSDADENDYEVRYSKVLQLLKDCNILSSNGNSAKKKNSSSNTVKNDKRNSKDVKEVLVKVERSIDNGDWGGISRQKMNTLLESYERRGFLTTPDFRKIVLSLGIPVSEFNVVSCPLVHLLLCIQSCITPNSRPF